MYLFIFYFVYDSWEKGRKKWIISDLPVIVFITEAQFEEKTWGPIYEQTFFDILDQLKKNEKQKGVLAVAKKRAVNQFIMHSDW